MEAESTLPLAAGRAYEAGSRPGRELSRDAVLHAGNPSRSHDLCKRGQHTRGLVRCQRAPLLGNAEFPACGGDVEFDHAGREPCQSVEVSREGAYVATRDGTGEGRVDTDSSSIGERLLHETAVDRERSALIQPGDGTERDYGVEQGDESA